MQYSEIEVTAIRPYSGSETLMAYVDVRIGDIIIHGVKILQKDNRDLWTAMPSTEKDGKFFDVVEIDSRSLDRKIKGEIVRQYRQLAGVADGTVRNEPPASPFDFSEEEQK